jgi:hypothetical protein
MPRHLLEPLNSPGVISIGGTRLGPNVNHNLGRKLELLMPAAIKRQRSDEPRVRITVHPVRGHDRSRPEASGFLVP